MKLSIRYRAKGGLTVSRKYDLTPEVSLVHLGPSVSFELAEKLYHQFLFLRSLKRYDFQLQYFIGQLDTVLFLCKYSVYKTKASELYFTFSLCIFTSQIKILTLNYCTNVALYFFERTFTRFSLHIWDFFVAFFRVGYHW